MSAAPDLYAACKSLISKHEGCLFDPLNPCWDGRPTDVIGRHWGADEQSFVSACAYCHAIAAINKTEG